MTELKVLLEAFAFLLAGIVLSILFCDYLSDEPVHPSTNKQLVTLAESTAPPKMSEQSTLESSHFSSNLAKLPNTTISQIKQSTKLFILIFSNPHSMELRAAVRSTWLLTHPHDILYRFVISVEGLEEEQLKQLKEENSLYNDALFLRLHYTLTYNSLQLLTALQWTLNNVHFSYILKCNDASYVLLNHLMQKIELLSANNYLVWGYFIGNQNVSRHGDQAERTWNLCSTYLPYPQGGGYVLSYQVVNLIISIGTELDHLDNEDIALGVWLAPFKHITRQHDINFNSGPKSRGCSNTYIVSHPETPVSMVTKHKHILTVGYLCKEEINYLPSYQYNWTVPMIYCCQ